MATFEGYLRGITERSSLRKHMLTAEIDDKNRLLFRIHPHGTSFADEPIYYVTGSTVESSVAYSGSGSIINELGQHEKTKSWLDTVNQVRDLWNSVEKGALLALTKGGDSPEFAALEAGVRQRIEKLLATFPKETE